MNQATRIAATLAIATLFALQGVHAKPAKEDVTIELNLSGIATRTNGGPDDSFMVTINVTGEGVRHTPNGNGVQVRANDLTVDVVVTQTQDDTVVEVANFTVRMKFHAQQASSIAQGITDGFRFHMELVGKRSDKVDRNEFPDERLLSMNLHGNTTGMTADEDGFMAILSKGQITSQPQGQGSGARHFNLDLMGQGRITGA